MPITLKNGECDVVKRSTITYYDIEGLIDELMKLDSATVYKIKDSIKIKIFNTTKKLEEVLLDIIEEYLISRSIISISAIETIKKRTRKRDIVYCRNFYSWYMYFNTPVNLEYVGSRIGYDHATIINSLKNYIRLVHGKYPEFNFFEDSITKFGINYSSCHVLKEDTLKRYLEFEGIEPKTVINEQ